MSYICADRGTECCPCALMEAGQCYTCGMISRGKCDCNSGWQGVCPYSEYVMRGKTSSPGKADRLFTVEEKEDFAPDFSVVRLGAPRGFSLKCRRPGSFIMVKSGSWFTPLSVMTCGGESVSVAVNAAGPKTMEILRRTATGTVWEIRGPFTSGLIGGENIDSKAPSLIAARGMSLMPLLNIKEQLSGKIKKFYFDPGRLPHDFLAKYAKGFEWEETAMETEAEAVAEKIISCLEDCVRHAGRRPNVFIMVSPYYEEKFRTALSASNITIIRPNHSNMCCGEGLCGACSYTDEEGVTVRKCKCFDM